MRNPEFKATMKAAAAVLKQPMRIQPSTRIRVGVDLGTAYTVLVVVNDDGAPLAIANTFADVVRDGIVWDFAGAQKVVRELKDRLEEATGRELNRGAVTIPPAVGTSDHRAHRYVIEGAGIECSAVVDETTAANSVLGIHNGAVVDIGGGTTGVAILRDGKTIATFDEPTGGIHLSLVISGAFGISLEAAEKRKLKPRLQRDLLPVVRPTLEKIATIVLDAIGGYDVEHIHLVGGTAAFFGAAGIIAEVTGRHTTLAPQPMLVTPVGVARWADPIKQ